MRIFLLLVPSVEVMVNHHLLQQQPSWLPQLETCHCAHLINLGLKCSEVVGACYPCLNLMEGFRGSGCLLYVPSLNLMEGFRGSECLLYVPSLNLMEGFRSSGCLLSQPKPYGRIQS